MNSEYSGYQVSCVLNPHWISQVDCMPATSTGGTYSLGCWALSVLYEFCRTLVCRNSYDLVCVVLVNRRWLKLTSCVCTRSCVQSVWRRCWYARSRGVSTVGVFFRQSTRPASSFQSLLPVVGNLLQNWYYSRGLMALFWRLYLSSSLFQSVNHCDIYSSTSLLLDFGIVQKTVKNSMFCVFFGTCCELCIATCAIFKILYHSSYLNV